MLGQKISINKLALIALTAFSSHAAAADYFPLQAGNQWVYKMTGFAPGPPVVVDIPRAETINGRTYHIVRGLGERPLPMRMQDGVLYALDPDTFSEAVYADFNTPAGSNYRTMVDPCSNAAVVRSRSASVRTPAAEFTGAFYAEYPSANCADAGLAGDYFAPYIGLVKRTMITIGGPRSLELIYSRTGDVTTIAAPEISFTLALDRSAYDGPAPQITARLTFRVTEGKPIRLTFNSSQTHDLAVYNERGTEVARWSSGMAFLAVITEETFGPGERSFTAVLALKDKEGKRLPPGRYVAEGYLATTGDKPYSARVAFEILPDAE